MFCVAKKWSELRPLNSDGTSNQFSIHCSYHFKGLCDTRKITHLLLKMADNHLCILYSRHILKYGGNHYPYFNYDEKNQRSDWIKPDASVSKERHASQFPEINSDTKVRRDAGNKSELYMIVRRVILYLQILMYMLTKGCIRKRENQHTALMHITY